MRRVPFWLLALGALLGCGVVGFFFSPVAEPTPVVQFEVVAPERAVVRSPTVLEVRVANRGDTPIRDLGVKLNRGYSNAMTVVETRPLATIDDASTEKRLYFGPLEPGQAEVYRITMVPQRVGEFQLVLRLVAARRGFEPVALTDQASGQSEVTATTTVQEGRPATPGATRP